MNGGKKNRKEAADGVEGAVRMALSLLAYKENTEKELRTKLIDRGCSEEDADSAIAYVVQKRYLSEERYFMRFVESCARTRLLGRRRILAEAKRKGFSEKTVSAFAEKAFGAIDFDECCFEAYKKCRLPTKEKIVQALLRKGYGIDNIKAAFRKAGKSGGS